MNTGYSTKVLMYLIDRRPADALSCTLVTAHHDLALVQIDLAAACADSGI